MVMVLVAKTKENKAAMCEMSKTCFSQWVENGTRSFNLSSVFLVL